MRIDVSCRWFTLTFDTVVREDAEPLDRDPHSTTAAQIEQAAGYQDVIYEDRIGFRSNT